MPTPPPSSTNCRPLIGITMGDPLGVGPEVIVKALADAELRSQARFIIFGLHEVLAIAADLAEVNPFWWREPYEYGARVGSGVLLADFDDLPAVRVNGTRAPESLPGAASYRFVEEGVRSLKAGLVDALVTAPISKEAWRLAGHRAVGHTQVLSEIFETRRVTMAFVADNLRVALASAHVPLFELRNRFTIGLVHQPIDLLDRALREWFGIERPRIGVLGLNPHAGEAGILGDEEQRIIEPALAMARSAQIDVTGPLPPDTAFAPHVAGQFDGLVAMYHDQGLIPVKTLAFHRAVQLTLGLGAIRTSPDHGTAFDIAGKNRANPGSTREAIRLAIDLAKARWVQRAPALEMG
jgi:4-phospho-D-threonate 3-dehydrogenase / 4-phospho-D-erythronate 3-dehydrogenase